MVIELSMENCMNEVADIRNDSFDLVNQSLFNDQIKAEYNKKIDHLASDSKIINSIFSNTELVDDFYDTLVHVMKLGSLVQRMIHTSDVRFSGQFQG